MHCGCVQKVRPHTYLCIIFMSGKTKTIPSFMPAAFCKDSQGNIWAGSREAAYGVAQFNAQGKLLLHLPTQAGQNLYAFRQKQVNN